MIYSSLNSSTTEHVLLLTAFFAFFLTLRTFLLVGATQQFDLWRGCTGMFRWWGRDRQGGPHLCCLEAWGLRSLRCWLVGWWKCPLPHLQTTQELQPHRSCSALCWIPRQNAKVLRCLLLQGWAVTGENNGGAITTKEQQQPQPIKTSIIRTSLDPTKHKFNIFLKLW